MRVISGTAKGRTLKAVPGMSTRPTTDKVKEAVFSIIGPYFDGGTALDLFAGTGGLGIEALSRGMERAIFVDIEKSSIDVIRHNLEATHLTEKAEVYRNEALRALKALAKRSIRLDLVFLDPPYRVKNADNILLLMQELQLVNHQATIIVEHEATHRYSEKIGCFSVERHAVYGETAITIYSYEERKDDPYEKTGS